jgi:sarcosine oxidase subunit beta
VLGRLPEVPGMPTDVSLAPYALGRFRNGHLPTGKYGVSAAS